MNSEKALSNTELKIWKKYNYEIENCLNEIYRNIDAYVDNGFYEYKHTSYSATYSNINLVKYILLRVIEDGFTVSDVKLISKIDPFDPPDQEMYKLSFNISWSPVDIKINGERYDHYQ